jgi:ribosome-associated translation inhibitor RaiA
MDEFREFVAERIGYLDKMNESIHEVRATMSSKDNKEVDECLDRVYQQVSYSVLHDISSKLDELEASENN